MIATFPFLTMIANKNYKVGVGLVFLISQFHSLQSESYFKYFIIFILLYLLSHFILRQLSYSKENILIFTVIQMLVLALFFKRHLELGEYILNGIGMIILNYIFVRASWRKNR